MTSEWRQRVEELFQKAGDLSADQRTVCLDSWCGGDAGLRAEVERLLAAATAAHAAQFMAKPAIGQFIERAADQRMTTPQSDPVSHPAGASSPAPPADDSAALEPASVLADRYVISRLVGAGGNGAVYLAADRHVKDKPVAVKVMRRRAFTDVEYGHFCREMETISRLSQIPGIVKVIDSDLEAAACPYLVTEFVEGWDLDEFVKHNCPPLSERVVLCADICDTLQAMHDAEVVHRDLKPSNIRVRRTKIGGRWMPVIVDFGLALHQLRQAHRSGGLGGTLQFMSPEHGDLSRVTRRSDMYSMGVILYWMLAESFPYEVTTGDFEQIRSGTWEPRVHPLASSHGRADGAGVPQDLVGIVLKAMSVRPLDRFQSAAAMADTLRAALNQPANSQLYRLRRLWRHVRGATDRPGGDRPAEPHAGGAIAPPSPQEIAERRSLARAFCGEISAMLDIARLHQYVERVDELLSRARQQQVVAFRVSITGDHFHVYRSNTGKIGQLPVELADDVVRFYTFAFSLVEDITRHDDPIDCKTAIARLERIRSMLAQLGDLGDRLVAQLRSV